MAAATDLTSELDSAVKGAEADTQFYSYCNSSLALQDVARQARAAQSQAKARAMAAADAAAQAEAKLAGQAMTGRGFMERIAQLKAQLHSLQQLVHDQASCRSCCPSPTAAFLCWH